MKNNDKENERLRIVKRMMEDGKVGRDPESASKRFSKAEAMRIYETVSAELREQKLRDLVLNTPKHYFLINNEKLMARLMVLLMKEKEAAVDTETTGVDVYTDVMVGVSITLPSVSIPPLAEQGMHVYIPFGHDEETAGADQLPIEYVLEMLRPFLYSETIGKILHNAGFDIAMFRRHGYDLLGVTWDTMIAMHLLNENEPDGGYKLKVLAPKYLGVESDTFTELFGNTGFAHIPLNVALSYAAKDTHITYDLYKWQSKHFRSIPTVLEYYKTVEVPMIYVIVDLEANGYILDLDFAKEYGEKLAKRAQELREQLLGILSKHHEGEEPLNLKSNPQMKIVLTAETGFNFPDMNAKKTLKPLRDKYPVLDLLLEYRTITKLSGTYIDALPTKQNPTTKRWHSRYNQMGTVTGRFSSGEDKDNPNEKQFNVQNQPKEARAMFIAPPGKVLVSADFAAQEVRCAAHLSRDEVLIESFRRKRDPYAHIASIYYKRPYHEVYKKADGSDTKERKEMKTIWLATIYGMSDFSLAKSLGIPKKDAVAFKDEIFAEMPGLRAWLKANEEYVSKHGYVWCDKKQRKRRLPDGTLKRKYIPFGKWNDPKYEEDRKHNSKIGRVMRQGTNAKVQGTSSIQTKVTMIEAHRVCKEREGWELWGSVHDELIFEIPEDFTREDLDEIRRIMLDSYKWDGVDNGTDLEIMTRWGEGVTPDEWFKNKEAV